MIKESELTKESYSLREVSKIIGLSLNSLRNYDESGKLRFYRTPGNHRKLTRKNLLTYLEKQGVLLHEENKRIDIIYARVSSNDQKQNGDLARQELFLLKSSTDLVNPKVISEVGSGLNDKRKGLNEVISLVLNNKVNRVFVTYPDSLTRFGFNFLKQTFEHHGTDIVVVKNEGEAKSIEQELVEDMMNLIASFSGRLYGMRSKKNRGAEEK